MNYDFPQIETIEDVLDDINGYDEIRVINKGDYTVINYAVAFENTFKWDSEDRHASSIRRECRGLIFNKEGKLISRPYHKFFNAGEKEETQLNKINLYEPHVVLEKLDGSMIRPIYFPDGSFKLATKAGVTDIAEQAQIFVNFHKQYQKFIQYFKPFGMTPIFEWCSRKNRIVIDYPEDKLILTAIRDNVEGTYMKYNSMSLMAKTFSIPVVKAVDGLAVQNINLFVKQVREWEDSEGIVLRFDNGHMIKVKADDYVLRHKSKDQISQEKNVLQTILEDSVDDLVPLLTPEDASRLKAFQNAFWDSVTHTVMDMNDLYNAGNIMYPDKKEFAVNFVQKMILPFHAPIMYAIRGGKPTMEVIKEMISKSLTSQTKIDENRWLWGNLNWNHTDKNL